MTSINRNFVNNINKLSLSEDRRIVRKIEKLSYRLNIARNAVIFINNCISDNLNPKYITRRNSVIANDCDDKLNDALEQNERLITSLIDEREGVNAEWDYK